jgi:hypothetical protein
MERNGGAENGRIKRALPTHRLLQKSWIQIIALMCVFIRFFSKEVILYPVPIKNNA